MTLTLKGFQVSVAPAHSSASARDRATEPGSAFAGVVCTAITRCSLAACGDSALAEAYGARTGVHPNGLLHVVTRWFEAARSPDQIQGGGLQPTTGCDLGELPFRGANSSSVLSLRMSKLTKDCS
ncbi:MULTISPECIES: hypothetical protein [unclassified Streptomyces]|uniref:hypothetical protein n=1 Tax=unclassified Streptomyces TaxID=2593676 RepID=UPI0029A44C19|nr:MULTISPECIES: hypothetical protein [unclassified Streptomyces]MDX3767867.1 hypothetical protein [Streptomyces sp. AK08-01B]MDX3818094.1 hypothetical protein [Streptomyces sp. AK08-01A]